MNPNEYIDQLKAGGHSVVMIQVPPQDHDGYFRVVTAEDDFELDRIQMLLSGIRKAQSALQNRMLELTSKASK